MTKVGPISSTVTSGEVGGQVGGQVSGQVESETITVKLDATKINNLIDYCSEPRSRAEIQKFCEIRSKFQQGIPHINTGNLLGYDRGEDGGLVINETQAEVVRRVYRLFLEGFSLHGIASIVESRWGSRCSW